MSENQLLAELRRECRMARGRKVEWLWEAELRIPRGGLERVHGIVLASSLFHAAVLVAIEYLGRDAIDRFCNAVVTCGAFSWTVFGREGPDLILYNKEELCRADDGHRRAKGQAPPGDLCRPGQV